MALRQRIVAPPSDARRPLTGPFVTRATCRLSRAAGASLLFVLLLSSGTSFGDPGARPDDRGPGIAPAALAVSVSETATAVVLRIKASGDVEPGSLEVQFTGSEAVVLANDAAGRAIRSQPVRLPAPVIEDGASADYDAEDVLVMTLRKAGARTAAPPGNPEAAAR